MVLELLVLKIGLSGFNSDTITMWQAQAWQVLKGNMYSAWTNAAQKAQGNTPGTTIQTTIQGGNGPMQPFTMTMTLQGPNAPTQEFGKLNTNIQNPQSPNTTQFQGQGGVPSAHPTVSPLTDIGFLLSSLILPQNTLQAAGAIFFDDVGADDEESWEKKYI